MLRNLFTLLSFVSIGFFGFSQTYNMSNGVDTTCSGTFYDDGGLGLYANNANFTQTFCNTLPGRVMRVNFSAFQTEAGFDFLCIYDGPTTASPLIGCYSGVATLTGQSFTSSSGCLTFNFTSDASVNQNGWTAALTCAFACQSLNAFVDSVSPEPDTSALKIIRACRGTSVDLFGSATYPASGTFYNQSNATSTFEWKTGDGFSTTGQNISHTFNINGIFDVTLIVKDTIGCPDTSYAARVIVSDVPTFKGALFFPDDSICLGDTAIISVPTEFIPFVPPVLNAAGTTFLPDGTGVSYYDTINVSVFDPTATFQSGFLEKVFINMEHSYLGDLEMRISCPNGSFAILKDYPGGGGTHLGEAVDPGITPVPLNPGIGYNYEFTHRTPTYGTMVSESGNYQHNFTDVLGNNYTGQNYLPAGSYTPFHNINTRLAGCPLNGDWIITVTDNLAVDNGYIFSWGLKFDSLISPPTGITSILPSRDSAYWSSSPLILSTPNDSTIVTSPTVSGSYSFTYNIADNSGCTHDTTLTLFVKPKPTSDAGMDFTTCRLDYQLAGIQTPGATSNSWSYFSNSSTGNSTISNSGIYNPNTTVNEFSTFNYILEEVVDGCPTYPDTVEITHYIIQNTIDISVSKDTICLPEGVTFTNNSNMTNFDTVYWEFGDLNTSMAPASVVHNYSNIGCYDVKITLTNLLGCKVDSVFPNFVCAYPSVTADFIFDPTETFVPQTLINFTNTSTGGTQYSWDFAGLGTSILQDDNYEFPKTVGGNYPVTLTVTNEGGCSDAITKTVIIKNPLSFWAPSSFTPNDDGTNDKFSFVFNNLDFRDYSLKIFNRWGELLVSTTDPLFEWDGTHNGVNLPNGSYVWKVNGVEDFEGETFSKIGHITIIR